MKSTRPPTSRKKRPATTAATSPSLGRSSRNAPSCSAARRRRSRATTTPTRGKYVLSQLTQRVDQCQMPLIRIVDLRQERRKEKAAADPLRETPHRDRRSPDEKRANHPLPQPPRLLHLASLQQLRQRPRMPKLQRRPHLSSHQRAPRCHICGHSAAVPKRCPECHEDALIYAGFGTEKVEATSARSSPSRRQRMDADSMTRKNAYRETLHAFRAGKIDILVGTQMIAKGLHFPNVTLVGIINADLGLHLPDFRAGERTFQLLTQVAGRAGRGEVAGRSLRPDLHPVLAVHPIRAPPRFRRLLRTGNRVPRALRLPALPSRRPHHRPLRARSARQLLRGNPGTTPPGSAPGRILVRRARPGAARKTARPLSFPHSLTGRRDHAAEPYDSRNARQTSLPRRRRGCRRCRPVPIALTLNPWL